MCKENYRLLSEANRAPDFIEFRMWGAPARPLMSRQAYRRLVAEQGVGE